jgi:hypothetical protein
MTIARSDPNTKLRANSGAGRNHGRHIALPNALLNSPLVQTWSTKNDIIFCSSFIFNYLGSYSIENAIDFFLLHGKKEHVGDIFDVDPGQKLLAASNWTTDAKEKGPIELLDHASLSTKYNTRSEIVKYKI